MMNPECNNEFSGKNKAFLILLTVAVVSANIYCYMRLPENFAVITNQLYYIPFIAAVISYRKRSIFFSAGLIVLIILLPVYFQSGALLYYAALTTALIAVATSAVAYYTLNKANKKFSLKTFIENSHEPLMVFDNDGLITDLSHGFTEKFGYDKEQISGKRLEECKFFSRKSRDIIRKKSENLLKEKENKYLLAEAETKGSQNGYKNFFITFMNSRWQKDEEFQNLTIAEFSDITGCIKALDEIRENGEKFRELIDFLPQSVVEADKDMRITFINKKGTETFGISEDDLDKGVYIQDLLVPEDRSRATEFLKNMNPESTGHTSEFTAVSKYGEKFPIIAYSGQISRKKENNGIRFVAINLKKLRETEEALCKTEEKLSKLMENFSGMAYRCRTDDEFTTEFISDGFYELTGYSHSDIIPKEKIKLKSIIHPDDFQNFRETIQKSLTGDGFFETRYRIVTTGKEIRWVWNQGRTIKDKNRNISLIEGVISNITKLVKTEDALKETEEQKKQCIINSLSDKETLLKEIHHRVKNNLQIIASILKLKDMQSENNEVHEILLDCRSRVFSMAMIHEKLYRSENIDKINFMEYITTLQAHLADEYGANERSISIICRCDENINLDIDTAIPCGLIINEILTNSLKYAFDKNGGSIITEFQKYEYGSYLLKIKDNGRGFPNSYDYRNSESLGMQLIFNLTKQLEGKIEVKNISGVEYSIEIPENGQDQIK
ncbi:PAS domain S-box-containing protein [Methanomicrobium sp. W14]|uniref:PAS domain S-box protein n=1 Tax=Methanomicrobium sp. W14 TaxID=2817839 RepID=UPI001AEA3C5E|nr:PAS domain S-box protein [Methanomicrobium sp. W14]MBP2132252.1 PAS domain S-box-containing protein [Methanomicrobium sp. W14]